MPFDIDLLAVRQAIGGLRETVSHGFELLNENLQDLIDTQDRILGLLAKHTPAEPVEVTAEELQQKTGT